MTTRRVTMADCDGDVDDAFDGKHATQIRLFPGSFQYLFFSLPPGAGKDEPIPG